MSDIAFRHLILARGLTVAQAPDPFAPLATHPHRPAPNLRLRPLATQGPWPAAAPGQAGIRWQLVRPRTLVLGTDLISAATVLLSDLEEGGFDHVGSCLLLGTTPCAGRNF